MKGTQDDLKSYIIPDYANCNLSISATLAEYLGAVNRNATLPVLKKMLLRGYKNIVFICYDGMGILPIETHLDEGSFFRRNLKQRLTAPFPSTTTNATESLLTNRLPLEHGWFGWSLYFEKLNRNVDIFRGKDSMSRERVELPEAALKRYPYYFDEVRTDYLINTVFPPYVRTGHAENNYIFNSEEDFFSSISEICDRDQKQFVYAYFPEPDAIMHTYGMSSEQAGQVIRRLSEQTELMHRDSEDTLFVVTADHGQIDVEGYVELYNDPVLMEMLRIYPFMESRAVAFAVKGQREEAFAEYFVQKYHEDFMLFKSADLVEWGIFGGYGDMGFMLGDYIAIGTYTHKQALLHPKQRRVKGHHTSLTEEMYVPLILAGN